MKKIYLGLRGIMVVMFLLAAATIPADAAVQTFHAKGEYTMSDYETPAVAEQRAFAYAKQSAAEQAGVYIASYTKSINAQISEERVNLLAETLLNVNNKTAQKEAMLNGDVRIVVEFDADVDTSAIDQFLRDMREDRQNMAAMYDDLQKDIVRQQKENEEMKQKIAVLRANGDSTEELVKESKAQERDFLSNQKLETAWKSYCNARNDETMTAIEEAIRLNPKNVQAYLARGTIYENKGEYDRAIEDCNRAITINPNNASAYNNRGAAYYKKGCYSRDMEDCNRAIENYNYAIVLDSNYAVAYNNRGVAYKNKGQYERAIEDYDCAIALNPNFAAAYINRGAAYYKKGQYDQAIEDYNSAIALAPNVAMIYCSRGFAYYCKGEYQKAIENYRRAAELDPSSQLYRDYLQVSMRALSGR